MRTVRLKHSTFSWLNNNGYDPYNSAVPIMGMHALICFFRN